LELAKRGVNIVLISRTQQKLDEVAAEIGTFFQTHLLCIF
jgi:short-subunit dehydrogenase